MGNIRDKIVFILVYTGICVVIVLILGLLIKVAIGVLLIRLAVIFIVGLLLSVATLFLLDFFFPEMLENEETESLYDADSKRSKNVDLSVDDNFDVKNNSEDIKIDLEKKDENMSENVDGDKKNTSNETHKEESDKNTVQDSSTVSTKTDNNMMNNKQVETKKTDFNEIYKLGNDQKALKESQNYDTLNKTIEHARKADRMKEDANYIALKKEVGKTENIIRTDPKKVTSAIRSMFSDSSKENEREVQP